MKEDKRYSAPMFVAKTYSAPMLVAGTDGTLHVKPGKAPGKGK